ncbi:MAG TPA: permease-like cell division protein FtsX [Streptomyces sp.]|uniref:permease-like cell division protein FtsX n=1 Tax=Streptomyces sp. TaxID=1931 RepID=UPI002D3CF9D8|nr:permease-like cell division protein FtsX [Streptomyces sp.]HZG04766.1 permease-like cell division protein FtsX [Streptomyces sp.]
MRAQFVLSEIGVGLRRNLTMTFAVIVSVALSLALLGGALLAREQVSSMRGFWYDKVQVSIYLCNENDADIALTCARGAVTAQQKRQILADLKKLDIVDQVYYESAEQAFKHYKEQFKDDPMADLLTPDQMQESYRVKLKDPTKFEVINTAFSGREGIQKVEDQRNLLENLFRMLNGMNWAALGLMGLMLIVALLLIVNTVRVAAFSRRRETGIMRLVGASSFYIQMPFIAEAAFAGLLGAVGATLLLVVGRYFLIDNGLSLAAEMPLINFIGWGSLFKVLPLIFVVGVLMPSLAAFFTLRKYLKV